MNNSVQFQRTDRAIMDALIRLLRIKSFEEITVQNILDETPVTRATFYVHYHDKFEVAERMQDMYLELLKKIPLEMAEVKRGKHPAIIRDAIAQYRDIMEALLKIRTDRVDLWALTAGIYKKKYMEKAVGPYAEAEAEIYAQTMTAFQLSYWNGNTGVLYDVDYHDKVMVSVFLRILRLEQDTTLRKAIFRRLPSQDSGEGC